MSNFRTKQKYKQQRVIKCTIVAAVVLLILNFYLLSLFGLFNLINTHTNDFIVTTQIKLENVRSNTLATLRQNEMQLIATDVAASGAAMSDIVTHLDDGDMIDQEYDLYAQNKAESAYVSTLWGKPESYQDWSKTTWYIQPTQMSQRTMQFEEVERGIKVCGMSKPFQGRALDAGYVNPFSNSNSIFGMKDSAIMCNAPLQWHDYYNETDSMIKKDPDWNCDISHMYPDWDTDWFSPLCRAWYIDQAENEDRSTVTDLYQYSDGSFGLTMCSPVYD
jgi:hypothetical protein